MLLFARRRLEVVIGVILLASITVTCAFAVLSYQSLKAYHLSQIQSNLIAEQLRSLNVTLSTLQDAEIGQRGYLLTQDSTYLEPYVRAVSTVSANLAWLNRSFSADLQYTDKIKAIQQLKVIKFAELEKTIQVAHREGIPAALQIVRSNDGKKTMDRIRATVSSIQALKRNELSRLQYASTQRLQEGTTSIIRFGLGILTFLLTVYFYLIYDLGDRRRLRLAGQTANSIDPVTGLHNSAYMKRALASSLKHAARDKSSVALMMIRVRPSAEVQKEATYDDSVNIAGARKLAEAMPAPHISAHFGAGVFALLVHSFRDRKELGLIAGRICDMVTLELIKMMPDRRIAIEVGIAVYPEDANAPEVLLKRARMAMLQPPHGRLGRYNFLRQADLETTPRSELLLQGLNQALAQGDFTVVYQPQVSLATKEIIGVEALIRWKHPDLGPISPDEFIPLAERTGLILPIGLFVLNRACYDAVKWNEEGMKIKVAVNVCALQLYDPGFLSATKTLLEECGLPPSCLEIELTERVMMDPIIGELLIKFKALGVGISIDDFGTGYSSLSYLSRFPTDVLKIDRSFIESVPDSFKNSGVVRTIINVGRELGITTIAEGIETKEQALFLLHHGCDIGQGYLFYKPMAADKIRTTLDNLKAAFRAYE